MDQPLDDLLLGSLELPDFINGAFWFDSFNEKLDEPLQRDATAIAPIAADEAPAKNEEGQPSEYNTSDFPPAPSSRKRRGRGRAKSNLTAEERRQKNREIQARYRAKQRNTRSEIEIAHSQAEDDLEKSRGENELVKERNVMLEKLILVKDVALDVLQGQQNKTAPSSISSEVVPKSDAGPKIVEADGSGTTGDTARSSDSNSLPRPIVHSLYQTFSTDQGTPVQSIAEAYVATERLYKEHGDLAVKCRS